MPTIGELVKVHSKIPGDIQVWDPRDRQWIRPFYAAVHQECVSWYGPTSKVQSDCWNDASRNYELYILPKAKVKRWLWAIRDHLSANKRLWRSPSYFMTEEECMGMFYDQEVKQILSSEIEFDE